MIVTHPDPGPGVFSPLAEETLQETEEQTVFIPTGDFGR